MSKVLFRTYGAIPLDAFTTFGVNHKPNSTSPFGYFGTGLKYAVSIILRNGGTFKLYVQGVEYEFYLANKDFRGKEFQQVRMRKRKRGMLSWMKSTPLPFTTELGKNWELWQAYRELESNTRDENGETTVLYPWDLADDEEFVPDHSGTDILIDCDGFAEADCKDTFLRDGIEVRSDVFLELDHLNLVESNDTFDAYEGGSEYLYYQGIRVHKLEYPSRLTYNLKQNVVQLSEDRSIKNLWSVFYDIASEIQSIQDQGLLEALLKNSGSLWLESHSLTYHNSGNSSWRRALINLGDSAGRSGRNYVSCYLNEPEVEETSITLPDEVWEEILQALQESGHETLADRLKGEFL